MMDMYVGYLIWIGTSICLVKRESNNMRPTRKPCIRHSLSMKYSGPLGTVFLLRFGMILTVRINTVTLFLINNIAPGDPELLSNLQESYNALTEVHVSLQ